MPTYTMKQLAERIVMGPRSEAIPVVTKALPKPGTLPVKLTLEQWQTVAMAVRFEALLQQRTRKDKHPDMSPEELEQSLSVQERILKQIGIDGTEAAFRGVSPVEK